MIVPNLGEVPDGIEGILCSFSANDGAFESFSATSSAKSQNIPSIPSDRYIRHTTFAPIGEHGQQLIEQARVAIIGLGALGSNSADLLARAGVGFLRIIDRDHVSLSNLPRCSLYTEQDAADAIPKAIAAKSHLSKINSEITIEEVNIDVNTSNIESLIADVDIVVDATDNFKTRYLLNEACHKLKKPWVYAGVLAGFGATMVVSPRGPCFKCLAPTQPHDNNDFDCETYGVFSSVPVILAALQVVSVIKYIVGGPVIPGRYVAIDIWNMTLDEIDIAQNPNCPCCMREEYDCLGA